MKQIPIIASKRDDVPPKIGGGIACALCAGMSHGTTNQPANYVLVIESDNDDSKNNKHKEN